MFIYQLVTEETRGEETTLTAGLEGMIIPGVRAVLMIKVTLSFIMTNGHASAPPPPPPLSLTE